MADHSDQTRTKSETELRDDLARQRTVLAKERTVLAYIRTALTFIGVGAGFVQFFDTIMVQTVGWLFVSAGIVTLLFGIAKLRVQGGRHSSS
ncbi:MAG TPA: DUF202 domain-containing protein [Nitrospiraceae bacterium]|nr:DUF202 domain-containing protein [Nitrospiraceae bacterium]